MNPPWGFRACCVTVGSASMRSLLRSVMRCLLVSTATPCSRACLAYVIVYRHRIVVATAGRPVDAPVIHKDRCGEATRLLGNTHNCMWVDTFRIRFGQGARSQMASTAFVRWVVLSGCSGGLYCVQNVSALMRDIFATLCSMPAGTKTAEPSVDACSTWFS